MKKMKEWKNFMAGFMAVSLACTGMAGCSSQEGGAKGTETGKAVDTGADLTEDGKGEITGEKVRISWGVKKPTSENDKMAFEAVAEDYNSFNKQNVVVEINFVEAADDAQYNTWLSTQLMGGTAPEVVGTWYTPAVENYRKGLVTDLSEELEKPNPYMEEGGAWKDQFAAGLIEQSADNLSDAVPSIPLSTVAVKVFYNKSIFSEAGIEELPKTYGELLEVCSRIQETGKAAFIVPNQSAADNVFNWLHRMFMDQLSDDRIDEIDLSKNGIVELNEICAAVEQKKINLSDTPWSEALPLIKDFSEYWYPGYNGLDNNSANDLFMRGEGAMLMNLGMVLKTFLENPDIDFEIGYFTFPYLTKEDSEYACEKVYEMGGAPQNSQCIPSAVSGEKLDAAKDFLHYLSSDRAAAIFAEKIWWVPPFKITSDMPEAMKDMYIEGNTSKLRLLAPQTDQLLYQDDTKLGQLYLDGEITEEEFNDTLQQDLESSVEQLKSANGWSSENNWGNK